MWHPFDNGRSIGTKGSENGVIVFDEEHDWGARITLERDGEIAPWSITCGIYGGFLHTAFASSEAEGRTKFAAMKAALVAIMEDENPDSRYEKQQRFAVTY